MDAPPGLTADFPLAPVLMGLLGGLAFFLFGLDQMTDALKIVAGNRMKGFLARVTTNRVKSALAGAFVTSIIQSSSVTTVLVVGFVTAGLMTLPQSIGVILGANIGTTVTAQIVAFKVTHYALVLVAGGFAVLFLAKNDKIRRYGALIMGLGMVFYGMQLMSDGTRPLRSYQPFIDVMQRMSNPALGILCSALFTGLVQSSSATLGVVIVLASQGFISIEAGIALAFGANVGTCVTATLAAIGKPPEAVRAAMVHVMFNVLGVILWVGFIDQLATFVRWLSPPLSGLEGPDRLAASVPRQIANAHTAFNLTNTALFIWFTGPLAKLTTRLVPDRRVHEIDPVHPRFLDPIVLQAPDLALDRVRRELEDLGRLAIEMLAVARTAILHGRREDLEALQHKDDDLDALHGAIVTYLGKLSMESISSEQSEQLHDCLAAANYIENVGDVIETDLFEAGTQRLRWGFEMSPATTALLTNLHDQVTMAVERAVTAFVQDDRDLAKRVMQEKGSINQLVLKAERHLAQRLVAEDANRLAAFRVETDIIENQKRIYYFAKRIAKVVAKVDMHYLQEDPSSEDTEA